MQYLPLGMYYNYRTQLRPDYVAWYTLLSHHHLPGAQLPAGTHRKMRHIIIPLFRYGATENLEEMIVTIQALATSMDEL